MKATLGVLAAAIALVAIGVVLVMRVQTDMQVHCSASGHVRGSSISYCK